MGGGGRGRGTPPIFFLEGAGGDSYLKSGFQEGKVTKILNFALKIKGGGREGGTCEVVRPCHPQNLERAPEGGGG